MLEERARVGVALDDLALEAIPAEGSGASAHLRQHGSPDAAATTVRHDGDVGAADAPERLDERAADRRVSDPRDQVVEPLVRLQVVAQVLDRRPRLRCHRPADFDHRLQIGVGPRGGDRELRELVSMHSCVLPE